MTMQGQPPETESGVAPAQGLDAVTISDIDQYQTAKGCLGMTALIGLLVAGFLIVVLIFGVPGQ